MSSSTTQPPWPYPRWIAHRGAGKLAPENTLAAFRRSAGHGYRMFECDVKLSVDGVLFLLHDTTLERTSNGTGIAGEQRWAEISQLDAGSWHSRAYAGEPLPTLQSIARYCLHNDLMVNLEIKPTPGAEALTGAAVARAVAQLWAGHPTPPLLSSFDPESIEAAGRAVPDLPRGLLLDAPRADWIDLARQLGCVAVILNHRIWNPSTRAQARLAGLRALCYTANTESDVQRMLDLDLDGIITDRIDLFGPTA